MLGAGVLSYSSQHIYIVHTVEWMVEKLCVCVCVHIHVCVREREGEEERDRGGGGR